MVEHNQLLWLLHREGIKFSVVEDEEEDNVVATASRIVAEGTTTCKSHLAVSPPDGVGAVVEEELPKSAKKISTNSWTSTCQRPVALWIMILKATCRKLETLK